MLKMRFPFLSDNDFDFKEGEREGMLDKLAAKLDKSRDELNFIFAELQTY